MFIAEVMVFGPIIFVRLYLEMLKKNIFIAEGYDIFWGYCVVFNSVVLLEMLKKNMYVAQVVFSLRQWH